MNNLLIISLICFAFCLIMFFYFKWYLKKRTESSTLMSAGLKEREKEIAGLIAEIDRITDRDSQLVEDRIIKLKAIIEETDKRIAVYLKELEKSEVSESLYTSLGRGIRDALSQNYDEKQIIQQMPADSIEISPGISSLPVQPVLEPPPLKLNEIELQESAIQSSASQTFSAPPSRQQIRSHIDLLLNEGLPPEEIASRLEISIAEVNLAKNLRRK